MKLTFILVFSIGLAAALLLGGLAWIQSDSDIALFKGIVFLIVFGIIGWGISYIFVFFKPELLGKETVNRERDNVDYVFPDEKDEER